MKHKNEIVVLVLIIIFQYFPYINKPFNVDDPFYIKMAKHAVENPLKPYSFTINWSGELRDAWEYTEATFPPLIPLYTGIIIKIFGERENGLHLAFLVFSLIGAISMYNIAKRFNAPPLFAALLLCSTPAFLVTSTTLMLDVPLLAFWLLALSLFIKGVDADNRTFLFLSSISAGICSLVKYTGLFVFPMMFLYLLLNRKQLKYLFWLIPGLLVFLSWCAHNLVFYSGLHFLRAGIHIGKAISLHKTIGIITFLSGVTVFPLFLLFFIRGKKEIFYSAAIALLMFFFSVILFDDVLCAVLFFMLSTASLILIIKLFSRMRTDPDSIFMLSWFSIIFFLNFIAEPWVAARYFLLLVPPLAIFFSKTMGANSSKALRVLFLALTMLSAHALNYADYLWAAGYKDFSKYCQAKGYNRGYFTGHFGFQYYLEKAGLKALEIKDTVITPGSFLLTARLPDPQEPAQALKKKLLFVEHRPYSSFFPVRIMDPRSRAGFYSSFWGIFPFSISSQNVEDFYVFYVK